MALEEEQTLELETVSRVFQQYGTDIEYLSVHFRRFATTKRLFEQTWPRKGGRVLDIGAHWLHQAYLYAASGYEVTAAEFPSTLSLQGVKALASAHGIRLVTYESLADGGGFVDIPDDSFDVILFTEILEHLTFNPVMMWREIHRLLSPGGRVIVTTPNYYAWRGRLWDWQRFRNRLGGGITVNDVLRIPTYGHHWKEYSLREVLAYFTLLSPDFVPNKALYVENYYPLRTNWITVNLERWVRVLRPNLHVEIQLTEKRRGIEITPSW